ncbi:MAG: hypothetical protein ACJAR0_002951, partial [Candidatus Azotimanducaceae bacterium]
MSVSENRGVDTWPTQKTKGHLIPGE